MSRHKTPIVLEIRLDDLLNRRSVAGREWVNVKIPVEVGEKVRRVQRVLEASLREVVLALINEGLDVYTRSASSKSKRERTSRPRNPAAVREAAAAPTTPAEA